MSIFSHRTTPVLPAALALQMQVVIITMDNHLSSAVRRAQQTLSSLLPGLRLSVFAAAEWETNPEALVRCKDAIAQANILVLSMLFMEDHYKPVLAALQSRRHACDAMVCVMSAAEVMRLTRMGKFTMDGKTGGILSLFRYLRGAKKTDAQAPTVPKSSGERQMKMLKQLPKLLRFVPGTAQDVRIYLLTMQCWLAGSEENLVNMVALLTEQYADGPRRTLRAAIKAGEPVSYPGVGLYHPRMKGSAATKGMAETASKLPLVAKSGKQGTVGLLLMRSYLVAGNTAHYDGVITALEARGLRVLPAFATGLDARPAIERYFYENDKPCVDVIVSLTGFSLVGGPAYNDSKAAEAMLEKTDVPYLSMMALEFQTLEQWGESDRGLLPVEATMMMAIPELDGSVGPMIFGGRSAGQHKKCTGCHRACLFPASHDAHDMQVCSERADMLAARVARFITLRRTTPAERKLAVTLFNFPPNAGATGTAAFLSVFASLHNLLAALKRAGYVVDLPESVDALREKIITGNAARFGAMANVHTIIHADEHVRREPWLREIEAQWGPAPGQQLSNGEGIFILGARFGNVFVGIQPGMGYEGDPMRLLFEKSFAPTHAFSAFYRYLREDFGAHTVLHFGTHGALEFMPGKQAGMSGSCWSDRLIGDLPNFYLYAANNPSEGLIAKRRSGATLISYLTPPIGHAGLYRGLADLRASIEQWRALTTHEGAARSDLAALVQSQAAELDLAPADPPWSDEDIDNQIGHLQQALTELEHALIPQGLHVVGGPMTLTERVDMLLCVAEVGHGLAKSEQLRSMLETFITTGALSDPWHAHVDIVQQLGAMDKLLCGDHEIKGILRALDGRYIQPAPSGDLLHMPEILPTGRNSHGFDPFRMPTAFAVKDGERQAECILARHLREQGAYPETVAIVLWGSDNLKSEGAQIAQALTLMGTAPRFDSYGRLAGATLLPLESLARPRIDVMVSLSGIFRDLLPLQISMLAEAAFLAASADEPVEKNYLRKHALAYQAEHKCDMETAALRVFGNAESAYGSNVGMMIDNGLWDSEDELAENYTHRKSFAYGRTGRPVQQKNLLNNLLARVDLAYQNLESVELGVTSIDTYYDTLGGISRAVKVAKGPEAKAVPIYISDQTRGTHCVRSLEEQVALESRTRLLNPKWFEGMLAHGYEGVRQIELHITNTMGWSATTGKVQQWVYESLTENYVLDAAMRERLAALNPSAALRVANRLIEASERQYWTPDEATREKLWRARDDLEDRLEGVFEPSIS